MKRLFPLVVFALAAVCLPPVPVFGASAAQTPRYAVAADEDVWFYTGESEDRKLFVLPYSYYVRVLERGDEYTSVEYLTDEAPYRKLLGYCKTDALTFVDFIPARPYLKLPVTVTYTLPESGEFAEESFTSIQRTFLYYGSRVENGRLYLYVLEGDTFGFLPAAELPTFEYNDDFLTAADGEAGPAAPSTNAGQIVAVSIACAAAVALAVLLLRGKRRVPREEPRETPEF